MRGVCERVKETKEGKNPFLVKDLETGYVVIGDEKKDEDTAINAGCRFEYIENFIANFRRGS